MLDIGVSLFPGWKRVRPFTLFFHGFPLFSQCLIQYLKARSNMEEKWRNRLLFHYITLPETLETQITVHVENF